jgi:ABC-type transport system substrate-binding protein
MNKQVAWWRKFGKPEYGGELVIRANWNIEDFDPHIRGPYGNIYAAWMETLTSDDWTLDPEIFDYKTHWRPIQYLKGCLAKNWEFTNSNTYVFHLRKGVRWQDIPPANGREFTAEDVVFHYNRLRRFGEGCLQPLPLGSNEFKDLYSVTAVDKYTAVFKWNISNPAQITNALHQIGVSQFIENPEAVREWGNLTDWHHAIGTGAFILKDFVSGVSATMVKNPNYWGYDERYHKNKLPYIDRVKYLIIPDEAEAIGAMRAGQIDIIDHISPIKAHAIKATNPEILMMAHPDSNALSIEPRNDVVPFNDIRVRKAMQMAIDLPTISQSHYQGIVDPYPCTLTSRYMTGWGFPYEEWPQDLKDEYTYNPRSAKELLSQAGYPNGFKTNVVVGTDAEMGLLGIIKTYFAAVGIDMEIRTVENTEWLDFVKKEHKHDQLAHRTGGSPLGHTSAPIHDLAQFRKGSPNNWAMVEDNSFDSFLSMALKATSLNKMKEIIRGANEYVARQHFTISLLHPAAYSLSQPWVKGFNAQFGSAWAHAGGPSRSSFYLSRFWIDHDRKKGTNI